MVSAPLAPTNLEVQRFSNTISLVKWTNHSSSTRPWDNVRVGVAEWNGVDWGPFSYTDVSGENAVQLGISTRENSRYRIGINASNSVGTTAWVYTHFSTTPAAPSELSATKSGDDIRLRWIVNANYGSVIEIHRSVNSAGFVMVGSVPRTSTTYLDINVTAGASYRYRVRHREPEGDLYSAWSSITSRIDTAGINVGSEKALSFFWGSRLVNRVYLGDQQAWTRF